MSRVSRQERRARQAELPFWQQTGFLGAAAFLLAVVLAGGFLLLTGQADREGTPSTATGRADAQAGETEAGTATATPEHEPATDTAGEPAASGCPRADSGTGEDALSAPPAVQWSPVGDVATALSSTDGPSDGASPVQCYAHSVAGAILAAHNFTAEANNGVSLEELIAQRVAKDGPVHEVLLEDLAANRPDSANSFSVAAYRVIEAGADEQTIALVYSIPQSHAAALMEMRVTVRWLGGDWLIWDSTEAEQLSEVPAGYLEWGPLAGAPE